MITIRKAEKADIQTIEELYAELEKDAVYYQPEHFVMSENGSRAKYTGDILESDTQIMLVAEDSGSVIGFAHVTLQKAKAFPCLKPQCNSYLQDLVVTEKYRSKGIGTMLIDAAKQYSIDSGAEFMRTQVFPMNEDGMRFYIRNGFSKTMITIECPLDL